MEHLDGRPLTLNLIRDTHSHLLNGVWGHDKRRGEFRRDQNWIGRPGATIEQATFVPPSPIDLPGDLHEFEKYLHFEEKDHLVQLAVIHGQFELLHPFLDGNGRVGRMLIPLFLFEKKMISHPVFYISRFFESRRDVYYDRLHAISAANDWDGWVEYFLEAVCAQAKNQTEQVIAILNLYQDLKARLVELTRSHLVIELLDYMYERPVFKAADFTSRVDAARNTVLRLLRRVEEAGLIVPLRKGPGRGGIVYRFEPLVELLRS